VIPRAHAAIVVAAVLFGSTFIVVQDAIEDVDPIAFLAVRFLAGAVACVPFAARRSGHRRTPADRGDGAENGMRPGLAAAGWWTGAALLAGYVFQTVGLQYTTSSVSAFVTYLLVVLVPVLSALLLRQWPSRPVGIGIVLATAGLVALTGGVGQIGKGELLTLGCALAFAVHILLLSEWSPRFPTAALNAVQLAVVGGVCLIVGAFTGGYAFPAQAWAAALYTGIVVSAGALGLQVWGQRRVGASRTSLLLMIEPVAAAVLGAIAGERLGIKGMIGAALILAGIAVAEAPIARRLASARS
jgi:drug/metabolite transporter (DMT)-like permease